MTDRRRIEYRSDLNTRDFEQGARTMRDRFRDMGSGLQELGVVGFGQLSQVMGFTVRDMIDTGREMGAFAVNTVLQGAQIETTAKSFRDVFREASDVIQTKLQEARRSMGLSKFEMEQLLTPIGLLATNAGFAADEAGELSGKLFTMAGDLATFSPAVGTAETALNDMQSALRGEFDPLEKWGVKLSAAKVQAEKLRLQGIDPANEALSDQQLEILAVESLIRNNLGPALGALERSEGTLEDSMRELESAWKDVRDAGYRLSTEAFGPLLQATADNTTAALDAENPFLRVGYALDGIGQLVRNSTGPGLRDLFSLLKEEAAPGKTVSKATEEVQAFGFSWGQVADEAPANATAIGNAIADTAAATEDAERRVKAAVDRWMGVLGNLQAAYDETARRAQAAAFLAPGGGDDRGPEPPEYRGQNNANASSQWDSINGGPV